MTMKKLLKSILENIIFGDQLSDIEIMFNDTSRLILRKEKGIWYQLTVTKENEVFYKTKI